MKNALVSPTEKVFSPNGLDLGVRIAEVSDVFFEVSPPLYWVECVDNVVADQWYWDGSTCVIVPQETVTQDTAIEQLIQVGPNVVA